MGSVLGEMTFLKHSPLSLSHNPEMLLTWTEIRQKIVQISPSYPKPAIASTAQIAPIWAEIESARMISAALAVLSLPIILLHHEEPEGLRSRLVDAIALDETYPWATGSEFDGTADVLLWGNAVSLILLDTLTPDLFLAQLLDQSHSLSTPLVNAIAAFPSAFDRGLSWRVFQRQWSLQLNPSQQAIAGALYCFTATPESWTVAMARSHQGALSSPWLSALLGALSGAYNSTSGLPFRALQFLPENIKQEICQYSQQLLTMWSGGLPSERGSVSVQAIATAGKLQKRRSRPIISQKF